MVPKCLATTQIDKVFAFNSALGQCNKFTTCIYLLIIFMNIFHLIFCICTVLSVIKKYSPTIALGTSVLTHPNYLCFVMVSKSALVNIEKICLLVEYFCNTF